jgi:hypothetical protein
MMTYKILSIPSDTGNEMSIRLAHRQEVPQTHLPNHLRVLCSNERGIERMRKRRLQEHLQVRIQELNESKPLTKHRKIGTITPKIYEYSRCRDKYKSQLLYMLLVSGTVLRWQELYSGLCMEMGKQTGNVQSKQHKRTNSVRPKVEKCLFVADEAVVVKKACESRQERRASRNSHQYCLTT